MGFSLERDRKEARQSLTSENWLRNDVRFRPAIVRREPRQTASSHDSGGFVFNISVLACNRGDIQVEE
jgi:hypothetical protein